MKRVHTGILAALFMVTTIAGEPLSALGKKANPVAPLGQPRAGGAIIEATGGFR